MNKRGPMWESGGRENLHHHPESPAGCVLGQKPSTLGGNLTRLRRDYKEVQECYLQREGRFALLFPHAPAGGQGGDGSGHRHAKSFHTRGKALQKGSTCFGTVNPHGVQPRLELVL